MLVALAALGHVAGGVAFAADPVVPTTPAPAGLAAAAPEFHRERVGAVSFRVANSWTPLTDHDESLARLQFVANLREVLDAAPDVPPGSFEQVVAFRAYAIPEINGYLLAAVVRVAPYPVQLFDVLHMHARGRNDWGESFYLQVEEVLRSDRFELFHQPALAVDVNMSGQYHLASVFLRVPAEDQRVGGLVFLVPSAAWQSFAPTIEQVRTSLRLLADGSSQDPEQAAVEEEWIDDEAPGKDAETTAYATSRPQLPTWKPPTAENDTGEGIRLVFTRVTVIALSYALIFFMTLRLIFFLLMRVGKYFLPEARLVQYREAAEENPLTLGLLKSEGMIMLCAIVSMALAAIFLGLVVRI